MSPSIRLQGVEDRKERRWVDDTQLNKRYQELRKQAAKVNIGIHTLPTTLGTPRSTSEDDGPSKDVPQTERNSLGLVNWNDLMESAFPTLSDQELANDSGPSTAQMCGQTCANQLSCFLRYCCCNRNSVRDLHGIPRSLHEVLCRWQ